MFHDGSGAQAISALLTASVSSGGRLPSEGRNTYNAVGKRLPYGSFATVFRNVSRSTGHIVVQNSQKINQSRKATESRRQRQRHRPSEPAKSPFR